MKLYHYAKEPYLTLRTSRQTVERSPEQVKKIEQFYREAGYEHSYLDHISFFFDPLPSDLGSLYDAEVDDHPLWFKGSRLWVHEIETLNLEFAFDVVESPEQMAFIEKFWEPEFAKDREGKLDYLRREREMLRQIGYVRPMGKNSNELSKVLRPMLGKTREAYLHLLDHGESQDLLTMYAPTVPHLWLYPKRHEIILHTPPYPMVLK